jgi:hypothetical protein
MVPSVKLIKSFLLMIETIFSAPSERERELGGIKGANGRSFRCKKNFFHKRTFQRRKGKFLREPKCLLNTFNGEGMHP